jgi:hypothetical protein
MNVELAWQLNDTINLNAIETKRGGNANSRGVLVITRKKQQQQQTSCSTGKEGQRH